MALPEGMVMDLIVRYPEYAKQKTLFFEGVNSNLIYYKDSLPTKPNYDFKIEYYLLDTVNKVTVTNGIIDWVWDNIPNEDMSKKVIQI
jgi:hypothetical protein